MEKQWKQWQTLFSQFQNNADSDYSPEIERCSLLGRKAMTKLDILLRRRDISLPTKVYVVKIYYFSSSHVQMWELYHKENWVLKNWCFWTVVLNTLEGPLDCKEIQPVNIKRNQPWIFTGRSDAKAELPILWLPDAKNWLIGKDLMLGKIKGRKRRGRHRMR